MAEKVTLMKLKVDLQCHKCYKKVKKVLTKFPQVRDQVYEEKQNMVIIKVVCCNPEKIRDKICCKGGGAIKSIEIIEPPKPKPEEKKKEPEKAKGETEKKKEPEKGKAETEKKKESEKPKAEPEKKKESEKPKAEPEKKKEAEKSKDKPKESNPAPKVPVPVPVPVYPPGHAVGLCCPQCYEGQGGGPCVYGYGGPPLYYDGYYARPVYDSYWGGRPYSVSGCDQYYYDGNPSVCSVM